MTSQFPLTHLPKRLFGFVQYYIHTLVWVLVPAPNMLEVVCILPHYDQMHQGDREFQVKDTCPSFW